MNIKDINLKAVKPKLYEKGTSMMWTDEHISKQLLHVHLNKEVDLASRKESTIDSTINWILDKTDKNNLNILDLGCGPGLYAEKLAQRGHKVTGVDFSKNSIDYATEQAKAKNLDIRYINENYLNLKLEGNQFDLVILIFTDFGVLNPQERKELINIIYKVLKPGGKLIFDVLSDIDVDKKVAPKSWEVSESGFWRDCSYLALSDSFIYEKEKVILYQHIVVDENDNQEVYRFYTHFFSKEDIKNELKDSGLTILGFDDNVLPKGDMFGGDNVMFIECEK